MLTDNRMTRQHLQWLKDQELPHVEIVTLKQFSGMVIKGCLHEHVIQTNAKRVQRRSVRS